MKTSIQLIDICQDAERREMLERCREIDLGDPITAYRSASRWRRLQGLRLAARVRLAAVMGGVQSGRMAS